MFGIDFADKKPYKMSEAGFQIYTSDTLQKIWGNGYAYVGRMNWQTAAYTARYNMKKAGDKNKDKVEILDIETGEIIIRVPEYQRMSRGGKNSEGQNLGGIGKQFLKRFTSDIYPHGTVIINAHESKPPRFYDDYYKLIDEEGYNNLKITRRIAAEKASEHDFTRNRLDAQERVAKAKLQFLKRNGSF